MSTNSRLLSSLEIAELQKIAERIAAKRLHNTRDVEDVAQETIVALLAKLDKGELPDNPGAWVNRVAANKAKDRIDYNKNHEDHHELAQIHEDGYEGTEGLIDRRVQRGAAWNRQNNSYQAVQQLALNALLSSLKPKERDLVLLVLDDVPHAQIAEQLGYKDANSVKSTWNRLVKKIKADPNFRDAFPIDIDVKRGTDYWDG